MARNRNGKIREWKLNSFIDFLLSSGIWDGMEELSYFLLDLDARHVKFKLNSIKDF